MVPPKTPPISLVILSFFGSFAAGPLIGFTLAQSLAPPSLVAEAVGAFVFPFAFLFGLQAWLGFALLGAVLQLVKRLLTGRGWRMDHATPDAVPSGSFVFVPLSAGMGILAGGITGAVSDSYTVLYCLTIYSMAGAFYGFVLWQLAKNGYLPFPDSEV